MPLILERPIRTAPTADTVALPSSRAAPRRRRKGRAHRLLTALAIIVTAGGAGVAARVSSLPEAPAVAVAVVCSFIVRFKLTHPTRRHTTVGRLAITIAVMIAVSATTWSFTGALTSPGSDPFGDRTANWMRDHHMNLIVDTVEQHFDKRPAAHSAVNLASLPLPVTSVTIPGAAVPDVPVASAPKVFVVPIHSAAPAAPPTSAPAPAGPLLDNTLMGEGQWTPNVRQLGDVPVTYTTFVRPDPQHTGVIAGAVLLEPTATKIVYVPGTRSPDQSGWAWGATIPRDQRPALVAAFNAGWRQRDAPGGVYTEGRTAVDLVDGKASLVIYADGHSDIGSWGNPLTMTPDVVTVVQNLDPIVVDSHPADGLATGGSHRWGTTRHQNQFTRRSGLGITANGALVYVSGTEMTTSSLAQALVQVGAIRGMELDIHNDHPTFNFFSPAPTNPDLVTGQPLLPNQFRPATRYLQSDQRDFFAVLIR